jgi:membrane-associated protease RseP (regulator of RpoE activity)
MSTLYWILAGVLAYTMAILALEQRGLLPESVSVSGPLLTVHTKRGRAFLTWLAGPKRFWRALANVGVGVAVVVMVGTFVMLLAQSARIIQSPPTETVLQSPRNVLVIPGVNDFLPLSVAPEIVLGLLIGMVVHEGGHGLLCRVEDIEIESMGVALVALLPVGAFVEPDEESVNAAERGPRTRMYAAGVLNNFIVTAIAFALLFGPVVGAIAVTDGATVGGVYPGGAAADADINAGDRIVALDGERVANDAAFQRALGENAERAVGVTLADGTETTVERSALLATVVTDSPFASAADSNADSGDGSGDSGSDASETGFSTDDTISAVAGSDVRTEAEIRGAAASADSPVVEVTAIDGETGETKTASGPLGVLTTVAADGPLAATEEAAVGDRLVLTQVAGERTVTFADLDSALADSEPGETVEIVGYSGDSATTYTVELGEHPEEAGEPFVGITDASSFSGLGVDSFGVKPYPAETFRSILGGDVGDGIAITLLFLLILPFAAVIDPTLDYNFAGFVDANAGFYEAVGPLAALGDGGVFLLANVLFWTGWINLNLAFFNCIPAFPLDGGHILRTSTEAIVSRLPTGSKPQVTRAITTAIGITMGLSLVLMIFGPQLLN